METSHRAAAGTDEEGEALAHKIALTARLSRDRIADRLEAGGETTLARLYRSTIV